MISVRHSAGVMIVVCVLSAAGFGQVDSKSLRAEFGKPINVMTKEVFAAAPHVQLSVSYDPVGQACVLVFLPDHWTKYRDRTQMGNQLEGLLKKAVPDKVRGKKLDEIVSIDGCAGSRMTRYERVDVSDTVFSGVNASCETQMQIEVRFTRKVCASPQ